jgi:RsiW-degrading membrane proteinase PrsW (M82 family)
MIPFLLILSVLPSTLILLYIYKRDKYEQEPLPLLLKAFGLGVLSTLCVLVAVTVINLIIPTEPNTGNHFLDSFVTAFFSAAIPEECLKFLFLYLLIWKNRNFSERFDGIIYAVFVSLGFATLENIMYVLQYGAGVALVRALTAVPAHALFGVAMGYYFSYAKFLPEYQKKYLTLSICIPIVLHGVYDFFCFAEEKFWASHPELAILLLLMFIGFVVFLWVQGFKKIKKMSADFYFMGIPANEVQEYINANSRTETETEATDTSTTAPAFSYLRCWYEITPALLEREQDEIYAKYPSADIDVENGIIKVSLGITVNYSWQICLTYARNYRKQKEALRTYIVQPDLNELAGIAAEIPYIKADLQGNYYLDVVADNQISGVNALDNALRWIMLFEKWVNGEVELNQFVIS